MFDTIALPLRRSYNSVSFLLSAFCFVITAVCELIVHITGSVRG